uniref:hypothetical protein n=1 Tax=Klebsiella pneumoniae TaxID=573 RepID=UPI0025A0F9BC
KFSCDTGLLQSAAMKFSLIAAIVLLALAQGSFAQHATELENFSQYFEELKNKMTQELTALINNPELASQAQTFLAEKKSQLEGIASQVHDQLRNTASNMEEQVKPLAANVQAQMQPLFENLQKQIEAIGQRLAENAQPAAN